ncbi:hypothetical protein M0D21_09480 [Aquimarina sp. D1M17]|uniref:bestrophin family protein n=1 Tax=Aquimarina acroporae TaxID=2937283 RepID=UPI0020BE5024|nr:bestrophin family ion channel [Aquimarina acroporae]MCK8521802.1 hypothetical protein [Aquimarina acroporae]
MFVKKDLGIAGIVKFSGIHLIWLSLWSTLGALLYHFTKWRWLEVPWEPITVIGTAVAFYVGFKNNNAYDRLWEARKIWGAIVNSSRTWSINVKGYVSNQFTETDVEEKILKKYQSTLVLRHIGWLYTLRGQLLKPTPWEHVSQRKIVKKATQKRIESIGAGLFDKDFTIEDLKKFFDDNEYQELRGFSNMATQILDYQAQNLKELRAKNIIDDFRHMELQNNLKDFFTHQGQCERIKNFPLPRQYASISNVFVGIFIFLLPFGLAPEFAKLGENAVLWSIPLTVLVSWIFLMMELVGDYSENPFEGLGNDIPMLALCRTIEIDLKEMIGEKDIPPVIKAKKGVLM